MLSFDAPDTLDGWAARLGSARIPVLKRSLDALRELEKREDEVVARDISNVILRDPMLTLTVLRALQTRRPDRRIADITTIEHAVMMMGVTPFFRQFHELPLAEPLLAGDGAALQGFLAVARRARHASLHARHWAALRNDIESDEVVIAALLHDMAELLTWLFAPQLAQRIAQLMNVDPSLRSATVQQQVLGVRLSELQRALCRQWQLPDLLQSLMDERQAYRPRARNALLAVALARHSAQGWQDRALPDDLSGIGDLLGLPGEEVGKLIYWVELAALADAQDGDANKCAACLPPAPPFFDQYARGRLPAARDFDPWMVAQALDCLSGTANGSGATSRELAAIDTIACALSGIHVGLGFGRVLYLEADERNGRLLLRYVVGGRDACALRGMQLAAPAGTGLGELLQGLREVADRVQLRTMLAALPDWAACASDGEFMALPLQSGATQRWSLIYADGRPPATDADEEVFAQFRGIVLAAEARLRND